MCVPHAASALPSAVRANNLKCRAFGYIFLGRNVYVFFETYVRDVQLLRRIVQPSLLRQHREIISIYNLYKYSCICGIDQVCWKNTDAPCATNAFVRIRSSVGFRSSVFGHCFRVFFYFAIYRLACEHNDHKIMMIMVVSSGAVPDYEPIELPPSNNTMFYLCLIYFPTSVSHRSSNLLFMLTH